MNLREAQFEYKFCRRKVPYRNRNVAREKARECSVKTGTHIHEYKCPIKKSHWHIGHDIKRVEKTEEK